MEKFNMTLQNLLSHFTGLDTPINIKSSNINRHDDLGSLSYMTPKLLNMQVVDWYFDGIELNIDLK